MKINRKAQADGAMVQVIEAKCAQMRALKEINVNPEDSLQGSEAGALFLYS